MSGARYHPVLVALHWLIAALVLFSLAMGTFSLDAMPNSAPDKLFALRGHMVAGMAILVLMLVRVAVRLATRAPDAATTGSRLLDRVARIVHFLLYAAVIAMAASGLALALQAGLPAIVFGGEGALPADFSAFRPRAAHGVIALVLAALVALHVAAALYHQLLRRDRLLRRMGFGRR